MTPSIYEELREIGEIVRREAKLGVYTIKVKLHYNGPKELEQERKTVVENLKLKSYVKSVVS